MNKLPPYPSMIDVLEADYNANYERWKRDFYDNNMTSHAPLTVGDIVAKSFDDMTGSVIKFLSIALLIIIIVFWVMPAMYYHGNPSKMSEIGTLDIVEDIMSTRELNGVYIKENEKWREATEDEIKYYMETRPDCG